MDTNLIYHVAAKMSEMEPDYPIRFRHGDFDIALFAAGGDVYATDNICTHAYSSLSDGYVEGDTVECPLHGACFNYKTGKALTEPATVDLRTYPVRIDGDDVLVALPV